MVLQMLTLSDRGHFVVAHEVSIHACVWHGARKAAITANLVGVAAPLRSCAAHAVSPYQSSRLFIFTGIAVFFLVLFTCFYFTIVVLCRVCGGRQGGHNFGRTAPHWLPFEMPTQPERATSTELANMPHTDANGNPVVLVICPDDTVVMGVLCRDGASPVDSRAAAEELGKVAAVHLAPRSHAAPALPPLLAHMLQSVQAPSEGSSAAAAVPSASVVTAPADVEVSLQSSTGPPSHSMYQELNVVNAEQRFNNEAGCSGLQGQGAASPQRSSQGVQHATGNDEGQLPTSVNATVNMPGGHHAGGLSRA